MAEAVLGPDVLDASWPWYWEGHIQDSLVTWLVASGWRIDQVANTATREAGTDIVAIRKEEILWVSVKGWPVKSIHTQARHWFAGAVLDLVRYRDLDASVQLAIGIPAGYKTYRNLIESVKWLRRQLPFVVFEVGERGEVNVIRPPSPEGAL